MFLNSIIPESPRWLVVKGKVEKAEKTMRWIGDVNGSPLADDFTLKKKVKIIQILFLIYNFHHYYPFKKYVEYIFSPGCLSMMSRSILRL